MTVLIAIPVGPGVPGELLDKAARHALAQTHRDLVVLMVGDGLVPPVTVRDDRLVVGAFPVNRGAPFTQQAMILGSPFEHYAPHGADDWIDRRHVANLVALRAPAAGSRSIWYHREGAAPELLRSSRTYIEFGVFRTDRLRAVGGYNPAEPCGQDSVLISILLMTGGVRMAAATTYHKLHREDSLTHHPDTRGGSPLRTGVRLRNREVLIRCQALRWRPSAVRAYRESLVPAGLRRELEDRAGEVARWLS